MVFYYNCYTDAWPAVYHQLNLEDQNAYLSSFILHDTNKPISSENEVSRCGNARHPPSHSLLQHDNKQNKFLSLLGNNLLFCFIRKTTNHSPDMSKSLSECSISKLLEDPLLEHQLEKFDSLILSFQWTESTGSASSDSMIQANNQMIDSGNGKMIDFCSGQLLMDTQFQHAESLRTAVTQLATKYKKSSLDAQKFESEEEVFSCSSPESLHSFHSVYPLAHNSGSSLDSFISINPELQNQPSTEISVEN